MEGRGRGGEKMSFNGLLINLMKVKSITVDKWGHKTVAVGSALPCRVMYGNIWVKDFRGEDVLSMAKIFCKPGDITFFHEDFILLNDETYLKDHPIVKLIKPQNSVIIHHGEIWIQ